MKTLTRTTMCLMTLALTGLSPITRAHPPGPADSDPAVGVSFGGGTAGCGADSDCGAPALGLEGHLGPKLGASVALLGDVWFMGAMQGSTRANQVVIAGAIQAWPVERLWLRIGAGLGHATLERDALIPVEKSAAVPALLVGAGVEVYSDPGFALDLQLLYGQGFHRDEDLSLSTLQVGLGLNWY